MENEKEFRPLHVPIRKTQSLNDRFAWLVGISIAIFFLACVVMAYEAHLHK